MNQMANEYNDITGKSNYRNSNINIITSNRKGDPTWRYKDHKDALQDQVFWITIILLKYIEYAQAEIHACLRKSACIQMAAIKFPSKLK